MRAREGMRETIDAMLMYIFRSERLRRHSVTTAYRDINGVNMLEKLCQYSPGTITLDRNE